MFTVGWHAYRASVLPTKIKYFYKLLLTFTQIVKNCTICCSIRQVFWCSSGLCESRRSLRSLKWRHEIPGNQSALTGFHHPSAHTELWNDILRKFLIEPNWNCELKNLPMGGIGLYTSLVLFHDEMQGIRHVMGFYPAPEIS